MDFQSNRNKIWTYEQKNILYIFFYPIYRFLKCIRKKSVCKHFFYHFWWFKVWWAFQKASCLQGLSIFQPSYESAVGVEIHIYYICLHIYGERIFCVIEILESIFLRNYPKIIYKNLHKSQYKSEETGHESPTDDQPSVAARVINGFTAGPGAIPWQVCLRERRTKIRVRTRKTFIRMNLTKNKMKIIKYEFYCIKFSREIVARGLRTQI